MDKWYKWKVLLVVLLTGLSIWKVYPPQEKIHLGLDLKGGMHLLLRVDLAQLPQSINTKFARSRESARMTASVNSSHPFP